MTALPDLVPVPGAPSTPEPFRPGGSLRAVEVSVTGVVQGVGFRPYVHRLAAAHGLAGRVRNEAGAVRLRLEGDPDAVARMLTELPELLPPLARIDAFVVSEREPLGLEDFRVEESALAPTGRLPVSPDVATCPACEAELFDRSDRRYRYPFITCTDCGPRFTVIESMPYDRERTSMRVFTQCPACLREYRDPTDRRYHSETNSCAECGPRLWFEPGGDRSEELDQDGLDTDGRGGGSDAAIHRAAETLRAGDIVAIRGLGGFHLAVRADDDRAVARLRERKHRDAKPLALMVSDLEAARRIARVSEAEARVLRSPERPIVVLERVPDAGLAASVSPGLDSVAVMLPSTPLHHLLLEAAGGIPLVMTSGNASDEPIAISNAEARARLSGIADAFLLHDREVVARYDDSVVRVPAPVVAPETGGSASFADDAASPVFLRRSRGYAPMPLRVPTPVDDGILAVGPHLKNTFTFAVGGDAFVGQHVGDLENLETLEAFDDAARRFVELFRIEPRWVVRDLHPGYLSTRIAEDSGLPELPAVQHHHAHVAAVAGEHGVTGPVLGLAFDGTGYGLDGNVWGCEFLVADLLSFRRVAHLRYAPLPGGDRAARTPWRSLLGYAFLDEDRSAGRDPVAALPEWVQGAVGDVGSRELRLVCSQLRASVNAPLASSLGRLFDAAAALLGVRAVSSYEGQAAMELEALAGRETGRVLPFPVREAGPEELLRLDPLPLLRALAEGRAAGRSVAGCAADFHESVAAAAVRLAVRLCSEESLDVVALGGGCFQNLRLLESVQRGLEEEGLKVLRPRLLSPNDGAVSYGQAVVAAARLSQ